jgi:hypothetical protein
MAGLTATRPRSTRARASVALQEPLIAAVRRLQRESQLTHDELAERLCLSGRGLTYLLSNLRSPNSTTLSLIACQPIDGVDKLLMTYLRGLGDLERKGRKGLLGIGKPCGYCQRAEGGKCRRHGRPVHVGP